MRCCYKVTVISAAYIKLFQFENVRVIMLFNVMAWPKCHEKRFARARKPLILSRIYITCRRGVVRGVAAAASAGGIAFYMADILSI